MENKTSNETKTANDANMKTEQQNKISINPPVISSKICARCEGEMTKYEMPIEGVLFRIPFTEIDVMWRRWNGEGWWCEDCTRDREQERGRDAYNAGIQEGYERAVDESRRGW